MRLDRKTERLCGAPCKTYGGRPCENFGVYHGRCHAHREDAVACESCAGKGKVPIKAPWLEAAERLKRELPESAHGLIDGLVKIREASNYGCRQCFDVSFIVDETLKGKVAS